jgi:hypothetical protein
MNTGSKPFGPAVVGVIAPFPPGVVRSCVECRSSSMHPVPCNGFGPGCLVAPRPLDAPDDPGARSALRDRWYRRRGGA